MASLLAVAATGAALRLRPWTTNAQGRRLYVDPADRRAWRLARHRGALDAPAVAVWRKLVDLHRPDLVIDVGANYGEVALAATYPEGAAVHLVEANPVVARRLDKSIRKAGVGLLHQVAASDASGTATLRIDRRSSGLSSLEAIRFDTEVAVPTRTVDELVGSGHSRCLFKLDVEGHEPVVLAGMSRTLAETAWVGLVENTGGHWLDAPMLYAIERGTLRFQAVGPSDLESVAADPIFTKDVVLSSQAIVGAGTR